MGWDDWKDSGDEMGRDGIPSHNVPNGTKRDVMGSGEGGNLAAFDAQHAVCHQ